MKKSLIFLATGAVGLGIAAATLAADKFAAACESAVKDRLVAPATYARISLTKSTAPLSIDEYTKGEPQSVRELYKKTNTEAVRHTIILTYDASNSLGTPIRNTVKCTSDSLKDKPPTDMKELVSIDGKTNTQWMIERIRR